MKNKIVTTLLFVMVLFVVVQRAADARAPSETAMQVVTAQSRTIVNQGKPGNEGPWPVTISSGGGSSVVTANILDAGVWINGSWNAGSGVPQDFNTLYGGANPVVIGVLDDLGTSGNVVPLQVVGQGNPSGAAGIPAMFSGYNSGNFEYGYLNDRNYLTITSQECTTWTETTFSIGATATVVAGGNTRYVTLAVSKESPPGSAIKCTTNGTVALGTTNPGEYLELGDSVLLQMDHSNFPLSCITNGGTLDLAYIACSRF